MLRAALKAVLCRGQANFFVLRPGKVLIDVHFENLADFYLSGVFCGCCLYLSARSLCARLGPPELGRLPSS